MSVKEGRDFGWTVAAGKVGRMQTKRGCSFVNWDIISDFYD